MKAQQVSLICFPAPFCCTSPHELPCKMLCRINASDGHGSDGAVKIQSHGRPQWSPFLFCLDCISFHSRGNDTQLLNSIWMTKRPTATTAPRARWSMEPARKKPAIDSAVDCQTRSCLSLFVPGYLNEEHMTGGCTFYRELFTAEQVELSCHSSAEDTRCLYNDWQSTTNGHTTLTYYRRTCSMQWQADNHQLLQLFSKQFMCQRCHI